MLWFKNGIGQRNGIQRKQQFHLGLVEIDTTVKDWLATKTL